MQLFWKSHVSHILASQLYFRLLLLLLLPVDHIFIIFAIALLLPLTMLLLTHGYLLFLAPLLPVDC